MFQTPKIPAFIQGASLEGKEDAQMVRFKIYITPIPHALACEVSPAIADRIFKFDASKTPQPIPEIQSVNFDIGTVDLQTMIMYPVDDPAMDDHAVMLKAVQISKISARKLFPEDPKFSLIFDAELPKDDLSFSMMGKYFKRKVFLTFETMQQELPLSGVPTCEYCENPAVAQDSEETFLCEKDLKTKAVGEVKFIAKKETPAEAEKRAVAAAAAATAPADPDDDRKDTSHINRKRKK
jgi:hypothetical protein